MKRQFAVVLTAVTALSLGADAEVPRWRSRQLTGTIEGRVFTPEESPATGVSVRALLLHSENEDYRGFKTAGAAKTDREGRFRISELPPGPYFLKADRDYDADLSRVPIFYPSEASPRRALPIHVPPGETVQRDINLRYVQPFPFTGELLDSRGRPIAGETRVYGTMRLPSIDLTYEDIDLDRSYDVRQRFIVEVDAKGRFRTTPLPPGKYIFRTGQLGLAVVHESDISHVVLQVHERATVSGRVSSGLTAEDYKDVAVMAHRTDGVWDANPYTTVGVGGTFTLGLMPGTFHFRFSLPEGWAPHAVLLSDGRNVIDDTVTVKPGDVLTGVIVEVAASARIEGSINPADKIGAHGYRVIVFSATREHWTQESRFFYQRIVENSDNTFAIDSLVPGMDYLVAVQPVGALRPPRMSDWLEELSKSAVTVSAPKAGTYRADIDLKSRK